MEFTLHNQSFTMYAYKDQSVSQNFNKKHFKTIFNLFQPVVRTPILCKHQLTTIVGITCKGDEDTNP